MTTFEVTFWDGSRTKLQANSILDAKRRGKSLNDSGVKKAVELEDDDDEEIEEEEEGDEEGDDE